LFVCLFVVDADVTTLPQVDASKPAAARKSRSQSPERATNRAPANSNNNEQRQSWASPRRRQQQQHSAVRTSADLYLLTLTQQPGAVPRFLKVGGQT